MAGVVGTLLVSLQARTDELERGLAKARTEISSLKKPVLETQSALNGLGESVVKLGAGLVTLAALKKGFEGVVTSGIEMQRLTTSFTVITGSSQGAQKALDSVRVTSEELGTSFTDLADAYKGIVAASKGTQLEGEKTTEIFRGIVSAGTALQLSQENIKGVLLATQQIMSKGTISAEDFKNQIGERLPGAMNILARSLNVTTAELTKMMEAGELPASRMLDFARQANVELGSKAAENAHTLTNEWERLKNKVVELGDELSKLGVNKGLTKLIELATMSAKGLGLLAKDVQRIANGPQLPEVQSLQEQFPTAKITGTPQAIALTETVKQLNAAQAAAEAASRAVTAFGDTDSIAKRSAELALKQTEADVTRLNQQYETQYDALRNIGEVSERLATIRERNAQAIKNDPTLDPDRGQKAVELQKELQQRYDDLHKTLGRLDERAVQNPGSRLEIMKEQAQELEKGIKALENTLSRNKALLPLLTGQGGAALQSNLFPKANAAGMAAALPLIQSQAGKYGLDPNLVAAVAYRESQFNPQAVSRAGAQGLMQLMPGTAADLKVADPFDLQQNLTGGMKYLQQMFAKFNGDAALALAAYNAGPGRVMQAGYKVPAIPETQAYVKDILERTGALSGSGGVSATAPGLGAPAQLVQLQDQLKRLQLTMKEIASADDFIKVIDHLNDELAKLATNDPALAVLEKLRLEYDQLEQAQQIRGQFAIDPAAGQAMALALIERKQRQVASARTFGALADAEALHEHAMTQGIMASVPFNLSRTPADQAAIEQQQMMSKEVFALSEALYEETLNLKLSKEALLARRLAQLQATPEQEAMIRQLTKEGEALRTARVASERVADWTVNTAQGLLSGDLLRSTGGEAVLSAKVQLAEVKSRLAQAEADAGRISDPQAQQRQVVLIQSLRQEYAALSRAVDEAQKKQETAFSRIAESFQKMVLDVTIEALDLKRVLADALRPAVKSGIDWLGTALGLTKAAVGAAGGTNTGSAAAGSANAAALGLAEGGSAYAGMAYPVGERGPELFVPSISGRVISHEDTMAALESLSGAAAPSSPGGSGATMQHITLNVYGVQDANSFVRSRGEVQRAALQAIQAAQRAA